MRRGARGDGRRRAGARGAGAGDHLGARVGRTIKFLYTIPNFHNPAGVTLAPERRPEVLEICRRHDILVLEDNPYGLLGFEAEPQRALRADEAEG